MGEMADGWHSDQEQGWSCYDMLSPHLSHASIRVAIMELGMDQFIRPPRTYPYYARGIRQG